MKTENFNAVTGGFISKTLADILRRKAVGENSNSGVNYLLVLTKASTGQVLHTDGNLLFDSRYEKNTAIPCIVVSDLTNAEQEARHIVSKKPTVEVSIFNENEEYIKTIYTMSVENTEKNRVS